MSKINYIEKASVSKHQQRNGAMDRVKDRKLYEKDHEIDWNCFDMKSISWEIVNYVETTW